MRIKLAAAAAGRLCDRNMYCLLIGLFGATIEETEYVWIHLESYESEKQCFPDISYKS